MAVGLGCHGSCAGRRDGLLRREPGAGFDLSELSSARRNIPAIHDALAGDAGAQPSEGSDK